MRRLPPRMFHRNTVRGRLSLRPLDGYGKARKAARCTETLHFDRNAAGEGMFRLNTDGVLLWGAGLCGRRYSRCTHCHEPHGGTVSNQTKSRNTKYLSESAETISQTAINCKPSSASTYKWMAFYWEPYVFAASFSSFLLQR